MDSLKDDIQGHYEESVRERFSRKVKESPFMPIGLAGLVLACGIGAYNFKNKGKESTSLYLMRLRVIAQGTVVGSLAFGVAYAMFQDYFWKPTHPEKSGNGKD